MSEPNQEKCAVCGAKLKRGEHRACRKCVVAVATMRAVSTLDKGICTGGPVRREQPRKEHDR